MWSGLKYFRSQVAGRSSQFAGVALVAERPCDLRALRPANYLYVLLKLGKKRLKSFPQGCVVFSENGKCGIHLRYVQRAAL